MTTLIHCIYTSAATQPFEGPQLAALLQTSRSNNQASGVTGMLLYAEQGFFQVLEGPCDAVDAVFERIAHDERHGEVIRIIREPIAKRAFGDWTMGFLRPSHDEVAQLSGMNDFFDGRGCLAALDAGRAKKLLAAFGNGRWRRLSTLAH